MKRSLPYLFFTLFLTFYIHSLRAQEPAEERSSFRLAIANLHTYVPHLQSHETLVIPAWGLEGEYFLSPNWAIAAHFELEMLTYYVEGVENEVIKREHPLIVSFLILREFPENLIGGIGFGKEYSDHQNFNLINLNASYQFLLGNQWDFSPGLTYNHRFNAYNSWSINLAIGRSL